MGSLRRVWKCSYLSLATIVHLYRTLFIYMLLYSAETTWTQLAADLRKLEPFYYPHEVPKAAVPQQLAGPG